MSDPFYSVHVVHRMGDDFVPYQEVYLLGPQFCGGDKFVIAKIFSEKLEDAEGVGGKPELPKEVSDFMDWVKQEAVTPAPRKYRGI